MILVISGAGGVGKGTLVEALTARDRGLWLSRSWTTRPRRPGEPPGSYTFVDRDTFLAHLAAGGFLEHAEVVGGHLYGTPALDPPAGRDVVLEIDVQGARQVREVHPDAVIVLVVAPSREVQEHRLRRRGDDDAHVQRRLDMGAEEERAGRMLTDHVLVNGDLDRAVEEVAAIVESHRRHQA